MILIWETEKISILTSQPLLLPINLSAFSSLLSRDSLFIFYDGKVLLIPILILYLVDRHYNRSILGFYPMNLLLMDSLSLTGLSEYCEIPRIQSYRMKMLELDSNTQNGKG
jgi:hypothetical protein